jgi:hypothetical protein
MKAEAARFDEHLERITTREQALRHLDKVLNQETSFNPSSFDAEIHEDPESITDIVIFFRSDDGEYARTEDRYSLFLNRYNITEGTIPSYKLKIDHWSGIPCIRVRISE